MTTTNQKILLAFGSVPKDSGTFTFYRTLRPMLTNDGIDMRCVSVGEREAALWDQDFADEGCVQLAAHTANVKKQARAFADWCQEAGVDLVIGINSVAILSSLPHLPENLRVLSRCANSFDHGYRITVSCYDRLVRIVTTTPRQVRDLTRDYGVTEARMSLIPNGIAPALFDTAAQRPRGEAPALRLGFLGRLEHNQKGVLFLPEILRRLRGMDAEFRFTIAGDGVHKRTLERELDPFVQGGFVEFVGALPPSKVPGFLGELDVFLFPSRFEGCPNALLEGLMAGCVPVAWELEGITDFIIEEGRTGFLAPMGDCAAFADRIAALAGDRTRLQRMNEAAGQAARERFSQGRVAADYARLIRRVMQEPVLPWSPRPWSGFRIDPAFRDSWRTVIPAPLKKAAKRWLFRLGLSKRFEN